MKKVLSAWSTPLALLLLCVISFGLLIPFLGFYWDDWPVILTGQLHGAAGFWQFYQYDRPISAWTYVLTFPLLGSQPINWQIFTLLLRWGTASAMWWTLIQLWPGHRRESTWAAMLFAIYPVFTQQSISVAYSQHWMCYLLYFLSLGWMVQAYRKPRWYWPLTFLALAASMVELLTMEYYAGLELLRPLLLWFFIVEKPGKFHTRLTSVLRGWFPYLLGLAGFLIWRFFFLKFPGAEANPPILLSKILASPLSGSLRLAQIALQDTVHLLLTTWTNILTPSGLDLSDRFSLLSWGIAGLAAAAVIFYLSKTLVVQGENGIPWTRRALITGAAGLMLGMLPVWFTDRQILVGLYSNRFGLPAIFGASLLLVAGLEELIQKPVQRVVLMGILVGLAVGMHMRVANDYRWSWVRQTRFYWQLSWRAPALQPGTAIVSEGEIFPFVGLYSTSAGINLLYPSPDGSATVLPYWFYSLGRDFAYSMPEYQQGMELKTDFRNYQFLGDTRDTILVLSAPETHDCLEFLTPQDTNIPDIPVFSAQAISNINLGRIQPGPTQSGYPPATIFGPEPDHGWCFYYQKASLAAQTGDWARVAALADQTRGLGYGPTKPGSNTPSEWLPLIEGYARTNRWDDAQQLSVSAFERDSRINGSLCPLWDRLAVLPDGGAARDSAARLVRQKAGCPAR
jgi:hypothetical protein